MENDFKACAVRALSLFVCLFCNCGSLGIGLTSAHSHPPVLKNITAHFLLTIVVVVEARPPVTFCGGLGEHAFTNFPTSHCALCGMRTRGKQTNDPVRTPHRKNTSKGLQCNVNTQMTNLHARKRHLIITLPFEGFTFIYFFFCSIVTWVWCFR